MIQPYFLDANNEALLLCAEIWWLLSWGGEGGPADLGASIMQLQLYNYYYTKFLCVVGWEKEMRGGDESGHSRLPKPHWKFSNEAHLCSCVRFKLANFVCGFSLLNCLILGKFTSMLLSISLNKFLRNFLKEFMYSLYLYISLNKFPRSFPRPLPLSLGYYHFPYLLCRRMTSTFALDYWDFVLCN